MKAASQQIKILAALVAFLWFSGAWPAESPAGASPRGTTLLTNAEQASTAGELPSDSNRLSTCTMDTLDDKHLLVTGDKLSFRIEEDQEEPKSLVVMDSGKLEAPYIGPVPAEDKTCRQLAREIKAALERDYYYCATVIIAVDTLAKSRGRVYLVGPIRAPGPLELPSDEVLTVSKAILRAGGFSEFADRHNVKVTRQARATGGSQQTFIVDVGRVLDKGRTEKDLPLEPGDLVVVSERMIRF